MSGSQTAPLVVNGWTTGINYWPSALFQDLNEDA